MLFGIDNPSSWTSFGIALTGLWLPAFINLFGVRQMAIFQNVTVVLKFLPLLAVAIFGWFFIDTANFGAFNASGGSLYDAMFDGGWIGKLVALIAVISGLGALNGWTMVTAEMPYAAAKDGLFLHSFAKESHRGVPWFGIIASTIVASLLMAWSYSGETGLKVFTYLVYLSVVTVAIPYFFSACAQLTYLVSRRRPVNGAALIRDLTVAGIGAMFSLWVTFASGYQSVYQAMLLLLLGIPVYAFLKARRERLGQVEEPIDVPELVDAR